MNEVRNHRVLLTEIDELQEHVVTSEAFVSPEGASVLWADYANISSDFGAKADDPESRLAVDRWLVEQCARTSEAQLSNDFANTEIDHDPSRTIGFRPPHYGRAAVFAVATAPDARGSAARLVDVKGCGVRNGCVPELRFHRTGLLPVREALREILLQRIIEMIFASLGLQVRGVPLYAMLRLGFDAKIPGGQVEPAALLLRRAHLRPPGNIELSDFGSASHKAKLLLELLMRRYGVTSANPRGCLEIGATGSGGYEVTLNGEELAVSASHARQLLRAVGAKKSAIFDVINIQTTRHVEYPAMDVELVDFGHYYAGIATFERPLLSLVSNLPLNFGCVFLPGSRGWSQPVEQLILNPTLFASQTPPSEAYEWAGLTPPPEVDGLTIYVASMARDIHSGLLDREGVASSLAKFLHAATGHLRSA